MTTKEKADLIKASLTMREILGMYGLDGNRRHNRIPCPIHDGKDRNFSFTDFGFWWFVCGAEVGLVHFVELYRGLSFEAALEEINGHFHLWDDSLELETVESDTKHHKKDSAFRSRRAIAKLRHERRTADREKEKAEEIRMTLLEELWRLDANKIKYAPKSEDEPFHPLYVEACHKLEYQQYLVESIV